MKIYSKSSVVGQSYIDRIMSARNRLGILPSLRTVYVKHSESKERAYKDCLDCVRNIVTDFNVKYSDFYCSIVDSGVVGHNSMMFSFGAILEIMDKSLQVVDYKYIYITKSNLIIIE